MSSTALDMKDRFWSKVDLNGASPPRRPDLGPCWLWTASRWRNGYGQFGMNGTMRSAHRVSWETCNGAVPAGLVLDHLCRVRHCVNPSHMEIVSQAENLRRGEGVGAAGALLQRSKTHCPMGHEYAGDNLYVNPNSGRRSCRHCLRAAYRRYREKRRAA